MNIHVSKNDTFAREIVTKVQQVRKCIMKHCISEFVFLTGRGSVNTYKMQRVGRWMASKDEWWNGNREVEVRHLARVSL